MYICTRALTRAHTHSSSFACFPGCSTFAYVPVKIWGASLKNPSARRKREFAARGRKVQGRKAPFFSTRREKVHAVIFISDALSANERARLLWGCYAALWEIKKGFTGRSRITREVQPVGRKIIWLMMISMMIQRASARHSLFFPFNRHQSIGNKLALDMAPARAWA